MDKKHKQLKRYIENANNILVVSHRGPDMDAFCSMLLVKEFLNIFFPSKKIVVKARQLPSFNIPRMHDIERVETIDEGEEDLIIIVDIPDLEFVCNPNETLFSTKKDIVVIDHHQKISKDYKLVINEHRSSASEQVIETFKQILGKEFKLTKEIAALGQYGINADTGRFLYHTTTPNTLRLFADLYEFYPIDLEEITYKIGKVPQESAKIVAHLLENINIIKDMAYTYISLEDVNQNHWKKSDIGKAVTFVKDNYLRFIQGVHWGFTLKPDIKKENIWWVSFRSTNGYQDVNEITKSLGGGGHIYASGAKLRYDKKVSVDYVLKDILTAVTKHTS